MRFETYDHIPMHPIAADYAAGAAPASRFDAANPYADPDGAWSARASWLDGSRDVRLAANREAVAEAVLRYNRTRNDAPEAIREAERLRDPEALVVVGGQQAGLFTGPMLVVYKAITVLKTARIAERQLGRPVVPVFWIAGEDHDWDEANHTYAVTPQLALQKLSIAHPSPDKRTAVSRTTPTPEAWAEAIASFAGALQDTEFKPGILDSLRGIAAESRSLSDAFAKTMSLLFGKHGLVLIDADDPGLRAAESAMFRELLSKQAELSRALKEGERAVAERGYPLQAESAEDGFNVFLFADGERKLLFRDGDVAVDRKGAVRLAVDELLQLAERDAASFSNNALTRPLMQEYVFPVLATVLGPSEIAYWSTLREAFHLFGQRTPIVVPRQQFTLLEGTVQKQMDKFGLSFDDAWRRLDERRDAWLAAQDATGLAARFAQAKGTFADLYRPLVDAAAAVNPGLRKLGETNLGKIIEQIDYFEAKTTDAMKQQHEAGLRQWERIRMTVAPAGKPQERVVNVFMYVNRYGFAWTDELIERAELDFSAGYRPHEIIYL
ncbi:bacillithiol biosynthesis cysteine-adding enzyme BshC [Paenibacillus sp.]|uniref:bacillithiol biosynthesis cysteine-adding enzyme BshC n=1 Tax=Paenibacillus sp. TaxID=58172 RepID=UPI002D6FC2AE|nr:bacillithiol biosynthesis cysteine-adding enzyme BshC [Paenibacillus sp.]HZG88272.1 bacillithiol biosynthesis cysteine-adding enzyme BshC [Paenibacillus sp.]